MLMRGIQGHVQGFSAVQIFKDSAHTLLHGFEVVWSCQQNAF